MYSLKVQNTAGNSLVLTHNPLYAIIGVTGLTPVTAAINTSTAGVLDGVQYNSARLQPRNIVITVRFMRNIENARIALYDYFQTKQETRLFFRNKSRNVYIDGYVENFDCDLFTQGETAQISIICPDPYFKSISSVTNTGAAVTPLFEFPTEFNAVEFSRLDRDAIITVQNDGDVIAGMDIELYFNGHTVNPTIYNATTGAYFKLNREFVEGDRVRINTRNGLKSVKLTRYGVVFNIINSVTDETSWLQLARGVNKFSFGADIGVDYMTLNFTHTDLFVGV